MSLKPTKKVMLRSPSLKGSMSVEEAIFRRRSERRYAAGKLTLEQVSQLMWCAQGITDHRNMLRATPSAGATYPLEVYAVVKDSGVEGLEAGAYHYRPEDHSLELRRGGDLNEDLASACLGQSWVREAPLNIVITAIYARTTRRYGTRGERYVLIEVGHASQNIYLQATAMGLGTVAVGAFYDEKVREVLGLSEEERPLYVMPIGISLRKRVT
ncbi:MAG: SagB/ThcOx family dehydrogenase [Nitrososphaerota archaeon]|nr:SagB/ThcOx family dehydrogenase [Aigarchaeota archaeon]MDW8077213.1 SagB/ThcOx family dehydrogenase [Nitrososphaerota archaeon]